jgi:phospholipase/carboxylesterase
MAVRSNFQELENISFLSRQSKVEPTVDDKAGQADGNGWKAEELRGDLAFSYRICRPRKAAGEPLLLLHGSGVDETTLVPLAHQAAPGSPLFAVRGRVPQEDGWRWFERITPTRFGQRSIRREAGAFAEFLKPLAARHGIDLRRAIFLGYSNGANLISSVMLLYPGSIRRAVLLRAMPVLDDVPDADLSGSDVLVITGKTDSTYAPFSCALVQLLRTHGAEVEHRTVPAGHEFGGDDAAIIAHWLGRLAG